MIVYNANTQYPFGFGFNPVPVNAPSNTVLEYTLDKLDHALLFQIHYQNPAVAAILKNGNYMAKNGMIISISKRPELRDSLNTIYLRGSEALNNTKPDVTTFTHNFKRDNRYDLVRAAIKEFADYVRKASPYFVTTAYVRPASCICF